MLWRLVTVNTNQRVLVTKNGRLSSILKPGKHVLFTRPFSTLEFETHNLHRPVFKSRWADHVVASRQDLVAEHFHVVATNDSQVAMVSVDGDLYQVLLPTRTALFWKDSANVTVEYIEMMEDSGISDNMLDALEDNNDCFEAPDFALEETSSGLSIDHLLDHDSAPNIYKVKS
jgi:hypothetical protein